MTTSTISIKEQKVLLENARAAVNSFVSRCFRGYFSREDIEDIVGNTLYKACRSLHKYDSDLGELSTWVSKIAVNCVLTGAADKHKKLPISQSMIEINEDAEECNIIEIYGCNGEDYEADRNVDFEDFNTSVTEVTSKLSGMDKVIFEMIQEGYTPKQMAEVLSITANAAAIRKHYILDGIKEPIREIALEYDAHNKKLAC